MVLLACHIPYVFFLGKEGGCIVVDEVMRGSTSATLNARFNSKVTETNIEPLLSSEEDEAVADESIILHKMDGVA